MLRVAIRHVNPEHLEELRAWFSEVNGPGRDEALATLVDEGCRQERAYLVTDLGAPVLIYVMDVEDVDRSAKAAEQSEHSIDAEHRRIMGLAVADAVGAELVLDLTAEN